MTECNFEKLLRYMNKTMRLDEKLELLEHLDWCDTCWDAVYQLSRDRDVRLFVTHPLKTDKVPA